MIRIPYPLNSYTRGLDGRIDDAKARWRVAGCGSTTVSTRSFIRRFPSRTSGGYSSGPIHWRTEWTGRSHHQSTGRSFR
jgi:hypothetical protein